MTTQDLVGLEPSLAASIPIQQDAAGVRYVRGGRSGPRSGEFRQRVIAMFAVRRRGQTLGAGRGDAAGQLFSQPASVRPPAAGADTRKTGLLQMRQRGPGW